MYVNINLIVVGHMSILVPIKKHLKRINILKIIELNLEIILSMLT
jgi:hypothetical protein